MTTASICTIGDEILIGQIVDTNSSKISQALNRIGVKVQYMLSIGDDRNEIITKLDKCLKQTNIVIVTGGLGPTKDDITKDALASLSGASGYKESAEQLAIVKRILGARHIELLDINLAQAQVPNTCEVIPNQLGTAPCMRFTFEEDKYGHKAVLYSLPGVPYEAEGLLDDILEDIKKNFTLEKIIHKNIITFGVAESVLSKQIESWEDALPKWLHLAYLPNATIGIRLRLSCYGADDPERVRRMDEETEKLREILGNTVYGTDDDTLQSILPRLLQCPPEAARQETISVAESCTGGHLSELITSIPGCSKYYNGSVTSYSNSVKINVLGVNPEIIANFGAVSRECAEAMARGVANLLDTDYSIATTGIAGPDGGSAEKPVGTCWIAVAHRDRTTGDTEVVSKKILSMSASRDVNIKRFASNALDLLRRFAEQRLF